MKDDRIETIKRQSIKDYLARLGVQPSRENGTRGTYRSPFRQEHRPSFSVDYAKNVWYDFGIGEGGSIIDLDMRMVGCSVKESIERLGRDMIPPVRYVRKPAKSWQPGISILGVSPVQSPELLEYARGRGIRQDVVRQYCSELLFQCGRRQPQRAIGFRNDDGGWELRGGKIKLSSTPKTVTTICRDRKQVCVFEGFMDFLSAVELDMADACTDVVVLNSVSNINKCLLFLMSHKEIRLFLDNDNAGREGTASIREAMPTVRAYDYSCLYTEYNDINDYLKSKQ